MRDRCCCGSPRAGCCAWAVARARVVGMCGGSEGETSCGKGRLFLGWPPRRLMMPGRSKGGTPWTVMLVHGLTYGQGAGTWARAQLLHTVRTELNEGPATDNGARNPSPVGRVSPCQVFRSSPCQVCTKCRMLRLPPSRCPWQRRIASRSLARESRLGLQIELN